MMYLTLHNLAKEYGVLPSEAMARATTFDLYVLDLSTRYSKYQYEREQGKTNKLAPAPKQLSQQEMQAMIDRVRGKERKHGTKTN